eukprot:CAMPEP_0119304014 /NCGR_PEP_ID=MMETSP1333-20130426/5339_1 /TAXON_ID=418940 /ORGANISM="Scyphosphaera apsteinii, Strain RCC1455" /LENGTH=50 /DNA_ID=CAMNT_0007306815 /DNA_START=190 /DNA_END=338 /DNA_ORIENTATION=+
MTSLRGPEIDPNLPSLGSTCLGHTRNGPCMDEEGFETCMKLVDVGCKNIL